MSELARLFLKLGVVAFGGPAAHIAMMRDVVVVRRKWMDDQEFLDLVGATNLIPGPNSTELAIHLGRVRAGWPGLLVAGACFIVPATLIVLLFAVLYGRYGTTPEVERLLYGIIPVIIAVIANALWGLLKTAVKDRLTAVVGGAALVLYLLGLGEIPLLATGALAVFLFRSALHRRGGFVTLVPLGLLQAPSALGGGSIFVSFLKIGAVLFGSGYVLLTFLRTEFVTTGLLTEQQLLDAVAVGQFTPGPVFTTATFIGYLLAGVPGAVLATVGIFLPAFIFVAVTGPFIPRLRRSPVTSNLLDGLNVTSLALLAGVPGAILATVGIFLPAFIFVAITGPFIPRLRRSPVASNLLDGLNVTSLALMAGVTWQLGRSAIVDPFSASLALIALGLLVRFNINAAWLVIGGGVLGFLYSSAFG